MPYYGSEQCRNCSGEDCPACSIYIENRADERAMMDRDQDEHDYDGFPDDRDYDGPADDPDYWDEDDPSDPGEMDGDHESGLRSVYGPDEYEHDTPLGEQHGNGFDNEG